MSADIIIFNDPEGINKRILHSVESGTNFLTWLINEYGETGFNVPTKIFLGYAIDENEIDQDLFVEINRVLKDGDIIYNIHRPLGMEFF